MAKEMTREELFNEVWSRPMTKIAADLGVSDVALKKICDKHRVPVPGRGYWAKVAAGKKVKRAHFRSVEDPALNRVMIYGSPEKRLPPAVKVAREKAKVQERKPENKVVVVPATPTELLPKIATTKEKLLKAKASDQGLVSLSGSEYFDVSCSPESVERVSSFLNAFVHAAGARGYQVLKGGGALVFFVEEETLHLKIVEQVGRTKHVPTEAEVAAIEKWERRNQRRMRSWDEISSTPRPTPPEWDYNPNGQLQVVISADRYVREGLRRTFADGKTQRIENLINAILETFSTWAAAIKEKRTDDARRKKEWEEQQRIQEERQRRNALEKKRIEALTSMVDFHGKHRKVLSFIAEVEQRSTCAEDDELEAVEEWLSWARGHASRIDPFGEGLPALLHFEDYNPWELRY